MSEHRPRLPGIEQQLDQRELLATLPIPPQQRRVLVAVHDLSGGGTEWTGTRQALGEHLGCHGGTANRWAHAAAASGYLHVQTGSRGGRYQLLGLQPARSSAHSAEGERAPRVSNAVVVAARVAHIAVASTFSLTLGMVVALTYGAELYRSVERRRSQRRAPGVTQPGAVAMAPENPVVRGGAPRARRSALRVAQPAPVCAQVTATPENAVVRAVRSNALPATIPSHSTVHSASPSDLSVTNPSGGSDGRSQVWWRKSIEPEDLKTPATVQSLYEQATAAGAYQASEMARLDFFAFAHYCSRAQSINCPGSVFTSTLGQPCKRYGKPFAKRFADIDRNWAAKAIKSLELAPKPTHPPPTVAPERAAAPNPTGRDKNHSTNVRTSRVAPTEDERALVRSRLSNLFRDP